MDTTYIGFNLNSNKQIEHFQPIGGQYGVDSAGGAFFFEQAEQALKGSYIPKEEVYCMAYQGSMQEDDIERYIKEMVRIGEVSNETHFPLRDIAFVHENASPYGRRCIDYIRESLQEAKDDPRLKSRLNAYRTFHQEKEKDTCNRVITAIGTNQGILLFNDSGRGLQYAQKYLQHVGDNFFSPVYRDADKLRIYYFSTSNAGLVKEAQKCPDMFRHGPQKIFLPRKTRFLDPNIMANYIPAAEYDMSPTLECYDRLVDNLNLCSDGKNYNIGMLDRICKTGQIGNIKNDIRFKHGNSFVFLDERIQKSYVGKQDGTLLKNSLESTIKDTAKRILQTDYDVRGYEPQKAERQRTKVRKSNGLKP